MPSQNILQIGHTEYTQLRIPIVLIKYL